MAALAGDGELQPVEPLAVSDYADILALGLQYRALLDMQLEHRMHLARPHLLAALPAKALQLVPDPDPVRILARTGIVLGKLTGEDARGHHGRVKPRTFFIGPVGDNDGALGFNAQIIQGAD